MPYDCSANSKTSSTCTQIAEPLLTPNKAHKRSKNSCKVRSAANQSCELSKVSSIDVHVSLTGCLGISGTVRQTCCGIHRLKAAESAHLAGGGDEKAPPYDGESESPLLGSAASCAAAVPGCRKAALSAVFKVDIC